MREIGNCSGRSEGRNDGTPAGQAGVPSDEAAFLALWGSADSEQRWRAGEFIAGMCYGLGMGIPTEIHAEGSALATWRTLPPEAQAEVVEYMRVTADIEAAPPDAAEREFINLYARMVSRTRDRLWEMLRSIAAGLGIVVRMRDAEDEDLDDRDWEMLSCWRALPSWARDAGLGFVRRAVELQAAPSASDAEFLAAVRALPDSDRSAAVEFIENLAYAAGVEEQASVLGGPEMNGDGADVAASLLPLWRALPATLRGIGAGHVKQLAADRAEGAAA